MPAAARGPCPARTGSWFLGSDLEELETALTGIAAVHARWWQSPRLQTASWLTMTSFVSVQEMQGIALQSWPSFLSRLSVPVTPAVVATGELLSRHLQAVCAYLLETPPLTLIHHDFHGDLMFPTLDGRLGVVVLDWQVTTRAHAAVHVAWLMGGQCEPEDRREHELDLVWTYHALLVEQGVSDYSFDHCWDDYRLSNAPRRRPDLDRRRSRRAGGGARPPFSTDAPARRCPPRREEEPMRLHHVQVACPRGSEDGFKRGRGRASPSSGCPDSRRRPARCTA